jgi:hypothetical protein
VNNASRNEIEREMVYERAMVKNQLKILCMETVNPACCKSIFAKGSSNPNEAKYPLLMPLSLAFQLKATLISS